jgi:PIN domain nuclease of toxin-antitoxin system
VKLLLDTNAFLWWLDNPAELKDEARVAIANPRNFIFVSAVSIVELIIKEGTGKLTTSERLEERLLECRFQELPFSIAHATAMRGLPPIHKDPFDRMLIAQTISESMTLVTRDAVLKSYEVTIMAA